MPPATSEHSYENDSYQMKNEEVEASVSGVILSD